MILILGEWPTNPKKLEGMVLRVQDIDQAFKGTKRCYLQIGKQNYSNTKYDDLRYITLSHNSFWGIANLLWLFARAKLIYAHSLLNLNSLFIKTLLKIFYWKPLVLDVHGVVPEEFELNGDNELAKTFNKLEKWTTKRATAFTVVSTKMSSHLLNKYSYTQKKIFFNIPTNSTSNSSLVETCSEQKNDETLKNRPIGLIYSGGFQKWQKISAVLDLFDRMSNKGYRCSFFTYDTEGLQSKLNEYPGLAQKIRIDHLTPVELTKEYDLNDFGVVLRDNILVNQVACPTKILDYLSHGLIPLVISDEIGDFKQLGAPFVKVSDIEYIDPTQIPVLKKQSLNCFSRIKEIRNDGLKKLHNYINSI